MVKEIIVTEQYGSGRSRGWWEDAQIRSGRRAPIGLSEVDAKCGENEVVNRDEKAVAVMRI